MKTGLPSVAALGTLLVAGCATSDMSSGRQEPEGQRCKAEEESGLTVGVFRIRAENRPYDLHRPSGVTVLVIEIEDWPGNEFGLWLPEHVRVGGEYVWTNWQQKDVLQNWSRTSAGSLEWKKRFDKCELTTTLKSDAPHRCLWFQHSFRNTSEDVLHELDADACFHLVNAPQFISIHGERYWAYLDDKWTTTDQVPRHESPDPRRVSFLKEGLREERTVVPTFVFPQAIMPEVACHPLFIAESFDGKASVGVAVHGYQKLFNNNDVILRCLHSNAGPVAVLNPGQTADIEGVILFINGDHVDLEESFTELTANGWPEF